ncbi:MAG TPA: autotransporter outer membrane beta-barrel domain-containing protein [Xanthobacteraceae bacterium]|nr:autotransporter outer membrane beta-barrel domain-containing protein [Xanthobacteraceae bacterium]
MAGPHRWIAGSALLVLAAAAVSSPAAAQNFVSNPGFENNTGCDATSWTSVGSCGSNYKYAASLQHTGGASLLIGNSIGLPAANVSQSISGLQAGHYAFSFWYWIYFPSGSPGSTFTASVGGQTFSFSTTNGNAFTQFNQPVTLAAGSTTVAFTNGTGINWQASIDDVSLTLISLLLTPQLPTGAPQNPVNVTQAIDGFINNGGTLPAGFNNLFNLTSADLQAVASQFAGEPATGAQHAASQLMDDFLLLMMEPGTFSTGAGGFTSTPFAAEQAPSLPPDVATAYASVLKAPVAPPAPTVAGWNVWGSAYGGAGHLNGDAAVVGSHDLSTSAGGFAAGADYRVTPDTRVGFALAGGFTGWGLSDGLGGGHGDAFQAGVYARTVHGPAYLAGALAFAEHWMSTDRFAMGDHLTADFAAASFGGRLEGGYRLPTSYVGVIPYAAVQAQRFHTPGFSETDLGGGGFGLAFNAQSSTDTRAELGSRFDKLVPLDRGAVLALRARLAWAHDWATNPALTATFQALPGASFVVNGAAPPHNSALVTFGPEVTWRNGWSLMAKFDGELASGEQIYAGTARLRYAW